MNRYYLAVDIGASSGRHIAVWQEGGSLQLKEIYRFENKPVVRDEHLCWDSDALLAHIIEGLRRCKELDIIPVSMAIDTWGVDYALVSAHGERLGEVYAYRDSRTAPAMEAAERLLSFEALYGKAGIQKQPFNTIYQLLSDLSIRPELLGKASRMLMLPDYLTFRLTGEMHSEYTIASTTSLLDAASGDWDRALIDTLGLPQHIFGVMSKPGDVAGALSEEVAREVGFQTTVRLAPAHDTASAVLAAPLDEDAVFLSSGTWSLMGVERTSPDLSSESMACNLSNEGGYGQTIRLLKNIMGLWMIQSLRREEAPQMPFPELARLAQENETFSGRVDVNHSSFLAPESMATAIDNYLQTAGQPPALSLGMRLACVYHSLAESYRGTAEELAQLTGKAYSRICLVGGGSQDEYLNRLTAATCRKTVTAGPVEATALGNALSQMLADGLFPSVAAARAAVAQSFAIREYPC